MNIKAVGPNGSQECRHAHCCCFKHIRRLRCNIFVFQHCNSPMQCVCVAVTWPHLNMLSLTMVPTGPPAHTTSQSTVSLCKESDNVTPLPGLMVFGCLHQTRVETTRWLSASNWGDLLNCLPTKQHTLPRQSCLLSSSGKAATSTLCKGLQITQIANTMQQMQYSATSTLRRTAQRCKQCCCTAVSSLLGKERQDSLMPHQTCCQPGS
jgi:hypothetical protein